MDAPADDNTTPANPRDKTRSIIIRLWTEGEAGLRGHVSWVDGTRIGAFDTLEALFELLKIHLIKMTPNQQKD